MLRCHTIIIQFVYIVYFPKYNKFYIKIYINIYRLTRQLLPANMYVK
jgi:hypothetical protein